MNREPISTAEDLTRADNPSASCMKVAEYLLDKHPMPSPEERCRLLAHAQLKGWIVYPNETDTPIRVMMRGRKLERALESGNKKSIRRAGGI